MVTCRSSSVTLGRTIRVQPPPLVQATTVSAEPAFMVSGTRTAGTWLPGDMMGDGVNRHTTFAWHAARTAHPRRMASRTRRGDLYTDIRPPRCLTPRA